MERLGNVWVSQLMQVQGMSEVWSGGIGKVPEFCHEKIGQELDNVYTPRKQTWTPRIHIVERKSIVISCRYHPLILLNLPSQHIKIDLSLDWVDGSVAGIWTHTHTHVISHYPDPWKPFKIGGTSTLQPDMTGDQLPTLQLIGNLVWSFHTNSTFPGARPSPQYKYRELIDPTAHIFPLQEMAKVVAERFASPFSMMEVWWIGGKLRDQFPFGIHRYKVVTRITESPRNARNIPL